jgi:Rieske Fe-S protein
VAVGIAAASGLPLRLLHGLRRAAGEVRYPVPTGDSVSIDGDNEVILVRWTGRAYAFNLACPHQNTALRWQEGERRFQCPKHKSRYRPDGNFISGRATRGMDRLELRREGDELVVNTDRVFKQDEDAAGWEGAVTLLE